VTDFHAATDGTRLAEYLWEPKEQARSTFVLTHGIAEHLGRYEHVARMLTARGHRVLGSDLRGFGRSDGPRAYLRAWSDYLADLELDVARARDLGAPVILMGHSLGGLSVLSYALSGRPKPDLLVASAPALDAKVPMIKKLAARILGLVLPRMSIDNGLRGEQLSRDPTVGERYFADPLVYTKTTLGLGRAFLLAGIDCRRRLAELDIPALVLHGAADTIVPPSISAPLSEVESAERHLIPIFRHEIFNEEGGEKATGMVADWVEGRL
jgi:acylglycerol lipase